jgi:hypothetical protein
MEIQIKKEKTKSRAGQVFRLRFLHYSDDELKYNRLKYIFLCCPEVSYFQWHPFTLTRWIETMES